LIQKTIQLTVSINNNSQEITDQTSIIGLLAKLQQTTDGIAVAINNHVIAKNDWSNTKLKSNDRVLIIQATQGG